MKGSLQDQLLQAGLVSKEQQKAAKTHKHKQAKTKKQARHGDKGAAKTLSLQEQQKQNAEKVKEERKARDQQLNEEREASKQKRAIAAAIQQLVNGHKVSIPREADIAFNFQHEKKVKKIWVNQDIQNALGRGRLAIVPQGEQYYLIPVEVAKRIEERTEGRVIFVGGNDTSIPDENDPYADYQIPDDLMW